MKGAPQALSVLRIVAALLFISHGTQKLFGVPPMPGGAPPVELMSIFGLAGLIETVGGTLLLLGLISRFVAFVMCGEMAVAYFMVHAPRGFLPLVNGGEPAVLYCFIFLFIVVAGPGVWSLDALWHSWQLRHRFGKLDEHGHWVPSH
jgi:putative oxidoreductase